MFTCVLGPKTKLHRPLPVDIDRLKPSPIISNGDATTTNTVGKPMDVRTPAVLNVVRKQSTQLDGSVESTYSKP